MDVTSDQDEADRGVGDRRGFLGWSVVAAVTTVTVAVVLSVGGADANLTFANITQIVAPLVATIASWRAAVAARQRRWRGGWLLISASTLSWCIGQCIWTWYESVQGQAVPFPSLADLGFLASVPFAVVGLLTFPASPGRMTARTRALLDATIVAGSLLFVSWVLVLGPAFEDATGSTLERVISLAYPASDVALMAIVLIVVARAPLSGRVPLGLVGTGFAVFAVADSSFVYTTVNDLSTSRLSNSAWVAGYLLIALGAKYASLHPSETRPDDDAHPSRLALLTPYLPLSVVLLVAAGQRVFDSTFQMDPTEFWIGIALIGLLLVRQAVVLLDNARLTASLAESMARLEHQALHDTLTGLPNRSLFHDRLSVALTRMHRNPELLAVVFLDLDGFKPVNDRLGHKAGDLVLITIADRINRAVRAHDTVARFGGDEFTVLAEDLSSSDEAMAIARRISASVATPIQIGDESVAVTCSAGMVLTNSASDPPEELLRLADHGMYQVKSRGRADLKVLDRRSRLDSVAELGAQLLPIGIEAPAHPAHPTRGA
jgi:diguanylate cyclase